MLNYQREGLEDEFQLTNGDCQGLFRVYQMVTIIKYSELVTCDIESYPDGPEG